MSDILQDLIADLELKRDIILKAKISRYPRNQFIASDIGDCDRQMVYSVANWQERVLHTTYVQALFDVGKDHERRVIADLLEAGFEVIEGQSPFELKNRAGEVILRGKIDGKLKYKGEQFPIEVKTCNVNIFNSIHGREDMEDKPHLRKYLRQLTVYLYATNKERGLFIFTDLQGHYKYIPVYLDLGTCEYILQRLERNWEHLKAKTLPDPIAHKESICGRCPFAHLCLQPVDNKGANIIVDEGVEAKLKRREELKASVSEYEEIDEEIKEQFKGIPDTIVGESFRITSTTQKRKSLDTKAMPKDVKAQYEVEKEVTVVKVIKL